VQYAGTSYSVPHQLVNRELDVRYTDATVEVLHAGHRVASHPRLFGKGRYSTLEEHRPASHRRYLEWTPSRLVRWAESVGPHTAQLVQAILEARPHPEQGFRSALGVMRLGKRYTPQRLEAAAERAMAAGATSYRSVHSILENGLDQAPLVPAAVPEPVANHANVRGPEYYAAKELPS